MTFACMSLKMWISFTLRFSSSCFNSKQTFVLSKGTYYVHPHWIQHFELTVGFLSSHSKMFYFFLFFPPYSFLLKHNDSEINCLEWAKSWLRTYAMLAFLTEVTTSSLGFLLFLCLLDCWVTVHWKCFLQGMNLIRNKLWIPLVSERV